MKAILTTLDYWRDFFDRKSGVTTKSVVLPDPHGYTLAELHGGRRRPPEPEHPTPIGRVSV